MTDREWLTINEACRILKVSRRTLYTYMEFGRLPFYQAAGTGHRRLHAKDLDRLMTPGVSCNWAPASPVSEELVRELVARELAARKAAFHQDRQECQERERELEQLRPLKAWTGHPCAHCGKPLRGVVKREVAEALLRDFVHKDCQEERKRGQWFPLTFTFLERPVLEAE